MTRRGHTIIRAKILQTLKDVAASAFFVWLTWLCITGVWGIVERGAITNRRGPDIDVSDNPLAFWVLNGFFGLGTILVGGMAVICVGMAITNLTRK